MAIESVDFMSRGAAEQHLGGRGHVLISISDPPLDLSEGFGPTTDAQLPAIDASRWSAVLRLQFHDVTPATATKLPQYIPMSEQQAKAVIDFIDRLPASDEHLVVHCEQGVSRSAAIALFAAVRLGVDTAALRARALHANPWVRRCLDQVAERRDAFSAATRALAHGEAGNG